MQRRLAEIAPKMRQILIATMEQASKVLTPEQRRQLYPAQSGDARSFP
jgi:Spy/CpxP family protein refolding chaperone